MLRLLADFADKTRQKLAAASRAVRGHEADCTSLQAYDVGHPRIVPVDKHPIGARLDKPRGHLSQVAPCRTLRDLELAHGPTLPPHATVYVRRMLSARASTSLA